MRTLICGSLAYDTIMVFPDHFARHILPEQAQVLSVSFQIGEMRREWGGCAGNIAYNLKHIGGEPVVMATIGDDGVDYRERLVRVRHRRRRRAPRARRVHGAGVHHHRPRRQPDHRVPSGRDELLAPEPRRPTSRDIGLGIIAPDGKEGMRSHAEQFAQAGIPFVFDPGQGLPLFDGPELLAMIDKARYVAVNDYEGRLLAERTGLPLEGIAERVRRADRHARRGRLGDPRRRRRRIADSGGEARRGARSDRLRRRLSRRPALRHRAGLGLGAHRRPRVGAGRAQDRVARRRRTTRSTARSWTRCYRATFGTASLVVTPRRTMAAPPHPLRTTSLPVRCYRWTRTCVHVLAGVATTMFVFPLVSDARRRRWSSAGAGGCCASCASRRASTARSARDGNVLVVANHISWLDIFVLNAHHPVRFVAKAELAKWPVVSQMIRGAGTVFIERERRRDTHRVNHQMARVLARRRRRGDLSRGHHHRRHRAAAVQELAAAADRRGGRPRAAGGDPLPDAATATISFAPAYVGDTTFAESFWCVCGERALTVELRRAAGAAGARRPPARPRARGGGVYPNGFGWTGDARRHLVQAAIRQPDAGQRAAPQAAGIEHQHVRREHELERRPVAADDGRARRAARRMREPRQVARRARARARASRAAPSCRRRCRSAAACTR